MAIAGLRAYTRTFGRSRDKLLKLLNPGGLRFRELGQPGLWGAGQIAVDVVKC